MSAMANEKKKWRDFAHTLRVLTASTFARHEISRTHGHLDRLVKRYEVELLAAASADQLSLPQSSVTAAGGSLSVSFEERGTELWVRLQLKGFTALSELAGREARLKSANGAVDVGFRFSGEGTAVCVLSNEPAVREGLARFEVLEVES